jgi:hypothetical protein
MMVKVHTRHLSRKGIIEKISNVIFMFFSPRIFSISQFYVKMNMQDTKKKEKCGRAAARGMKARDLDLAQ